VVWFLTRGSRKEIASSPEWMLWAKSTNQRRVCGAWYTLTRLKNRNPHLGPEGTRRISHGTSPTGQPQGSSELHLRTDCVNLGDWEGDRISGASRWRRRRLPRLCGLWAMEAWWISALVGGRALPPILEASFFVFRVKVCGGDVQVVVAMPRVTRSLRLQPISTATSRDLWECCGLRGFHLAVGILGSSRSFIGSSFFFFVSGTDVVFLTRSATFRPQPSTSGRLRKERQRQRVVDTV
jgi:hypothetical protein